jgi:hypothetical protein
MRLKAKKHYNETPLIEYSPLRPRTSILVAEN